MIDFLAEHQWLMALVLILFFPALFAIGYVVDAEVHHQWIYAPKWYKKLRDSKIGQVAIAVVLLIFILWALGAIPYTPAFYDR